MHFEYGSRVGIWRLCRLFDEFGVDVTFNACALALERNPPLCGWLRAHQHDILGHGYRWYGPDTTIGARMTRDDERDEIRKAVASVEKTTGQRLRGWMVRSFPTLHTRELLVEEGGFVYDSDSTNDELPYFVTVLGKPFLVVPYTKVYNDTRYLIAPTYATPRHFFETLKSGLDYLLDEARRAGAGRMMSVGIHPRWSGQTGWSPLHAPERDRGSLDHRVWAPGGRGDGLGSRDGDGPAARQRLFTRQGDRQRSGRRGRRAEDALRLALPGRLDEPADAPLPRVLSRGRLDLPSVRPSVQAELGVENEMEECIGPQDIERVFLRKAIARPGDLDGAESAVGEMEEQRGGVVNVPALALALRQEDSAGRGLDRAPLAAEGSLEIDVVAGPLQQVAAPLRPVEEPGAALGWAGVHADQQPEILPLDRLAKIVEHLDTSPLVAHGTHGTAVAGGGDDCLRVLQPSGDWLLQVDVDALFEGRHRQLAMGERRGTDKDRVGPLARQELRPPRVGGRAAREAPGARLVEIADGDQLDLVQLPQRGDMLGSDPSGADDADPHARG